MSTKTITLAEDAYQRLYSLKQGQESFSEVVRRLTTRKPLTSFAGLLTQQEANKIEKIVQTGRENSRRRAKIFAAEFKK